MGACLTRQVCVRALDGQLVIDPATLRNLEIVRGVRSGTADGSLLSVINQVFGTLSSDD